MKVEVVGGRWSDGSEIKEGSETKSPLSQGSLQRAEQRLERHSSTLVLWRDSVVA